MTKYSWLLCVLSVVFFFYAGCGDSEKELASGYTEEQNAKVDYEVVLKTWQPSISSDSTLRSWVDENGESKSWYEVDFVSTEDVYYSKKNAEDGDVSVSIFKEENGVRLSLSNSVKESNLTVTLNRDSMKAVSVDRLDNEYIDESVLSVCHEDSLSFVDSCSRNGGVVSSAIQNRSCNPLHLICTKTFEPTITATEYLVATAKNLVTRYGSESDSSKMDSVLVDARDGQVYKIVKIGNQTWMAQNLNYAYLQPTDLWDSSSFCYKNEPDSCKKYGRLYTWAAALDSAGLFSEDAKGCGFGAVCLPPRNVQGVCPEGWRIPNYDEWNTLIYYVGGFNVAGGRLKVVEEDGTDDYGFSVRLAGRHIEFDQSENSYSFLGREVTFHTTTEADSAMADGFSFLNTGDYVGEGVFYSKYVAYPVRCIKGVASAYVEGGVDPATAVIDSFTDARDNQVYKMTTIGKQTWMAQNLNYDCGEGSVCYEENEANCATYGRLYTWDSAMVVCPIGWRLPSREEMDSLQSSVGFSFAPLKSVSGWSGHLGNGTDLYGFNLLPNGNGIVSGDSVRFVDVGVGANLWTSTEGSMDSLRSHVFDVERRASGMYSGSLSNKKNYNGVRCVKE